MHFGKSNKGYEYEMDGTKPRSTTEERDLDILISNDSKQSEQCLKAANSANKILGMIKRNIKSRSKEVLYKALVFKCGAFTSTRI